MRNGTVDKLILPRGARPAPEPEAAQPPVVLAQPLGVDSVLAIMASNYPSHDSSHPERSAKSAVAWAADIFAEAVRVINSGELDKIVEAKLKPVEAG